MLSEAKSTSIRLDNIRETSKDHASKVGGAILEHIHEHASDLPTMREYWCPMCVDNERTGCTWCSFTGWKDGIAPFVVDIFERDK